MSKSKNGTVIDLTGTNAIEAAVFLVALGVYEAWTFVTRQSNKPSAPRELPK